MAFGCNIFFVRDGAWRGLAHFLKFRNTQVRRPSPSTLLIGGRIVRSRSYCAITGPCSVNVIFIQNCGEVFTKALIQLLRYGVGPSAPASRSPTGKLRFSRLTTPTPTRVRRGDRRPARDGRTLAERVGGGEDTSPTGSVEFLPTHLVRFSHAG